MVGHEYEVVNHPQLEHLNLFAVELSYRAPHLHDDLEIGMVMSGKLTVSATHEERQLKAGDLYLLNPRQLHSFSTDGQARVLAVQISAEWRSLFSLGASRRFTAMTVRDCFADDERNYALLTAFIFKLAETYLKGGEGYQPRCLSLLAAIACLIERYVPCRIVTEAEVTAIEQQSYRISRLVDTVEKNFRSKLLLSDIARQENLSMPYLSHFFKDVMHMTFQEYLNKTRFEYARMLIRTTDKTLSEISALSGFSDTRYFLRLYHAVCGPAPKERCQRHSKTPISDDGLTTMQRLFSPEESLQLLMPMAPDANMALKNCSLLDFYQLTKF